MKTKYGFNIIWSPDDNGFVVTCPDFPGFMAFGETLADAAREAQGVLKMFIESYNERGKPLPEPTVINEYSGQTRLRMPSSLHRNLAEAAGKEGVSLNTHIIKLLAERCSVKDFASEILEQIERLQKQMVTELIKGSEEKKSMRTSTSYIYKARDDYNVH